MPSTTTTLQPLPVFVPPMLAQPGSPFDSDEHLFEIKWDGTRMLAFVDGAGYRLVNRHRGDRTEQYPEFAFLAQAPAGTILDGEMVVLRDGQPDFRRLLSRDQARRPLTIRMLARSLPATYVVFDLLYHRYRSLLTEPLQQRRALLRQLVHELGQPALVLSEGIVGAGTTFFQQVCQLGLEGVVAKRLRSRYRPGRRTRAWIKIKA
jgi:ATP-dependent DNA ligase